MRRRHAVRDFAAWFGHVLKFLLNGVGRLNGVTEAALLKKVGELDSALARAALTGVVKVGGEVLEEELQLQLEPLFRTIVFEEDYEAPTGKEMLQMALIAALTNGVVEGPAIVGIEVDFGKLGQLAMQTQEGRNIVADAMEGSRPGSTAGTLAQSLIEQYASGKQLSNEEIGKLYAIVQADTLSGKAVKKNGQTMELLQEALAQPVDSPARQLAETLLSQQETALTELGMELDEQYQLSHTEQAQLAAETANNSVSDQSLGELARIIKEESLTDGESRAKLSKSDFIEIHRSVGAKAKNYDIELPNRETVHLTEGTRVTNIETIAGKGRDRTIDEIDILLDKYPGTSELEWQKKKGLGYVDYDGESFMAELHWYEEPTVGRVKWKVKPDKDGNWFYDDQ